MFGDLIKSVTDVTTDVVKTVAAPVQITADVARVVTKPIGDAAQEVVKEVKDCIDDLTD